MGFFIRGGLLLRGGYYAVNDSNILVLLSSLLLSLWLWLWLRLLWLLCLWLMLLLLLWLVYVLLSMIILLQCCVIFANIITFRPTYIRSGAPQTAAAVPVDCAGEDPTVWSPIRFHRFTGTRDSVNIVWFCYCTWIKLRKNNTNQGLNNSAKPLRATE